MRSGMVEIFHVLCVLAFPLVFSLVRVARAASSIESDFTGAIDVAAIEESR